MKICDIFNPSVRSKITDKRNWTKNAEFPSPHHIYSKEIVIDADPKYGRKHKFSVENDDPVYFFSSDKGIEEKQEKRNGKDDLKNLLNKSKFSESRPNAFLNNFLSSPSYFNGKSLLSINNDKSNDRKYSDISFTSEKTFNTDNPKDKGRSIFSRRFRSRFDFCLNDEREQGVNIPEYLSGIISFKTSTYFYLKNVDIKEYIERYNINQFELERLSLLNLKVSSL